MSEKTHVGTVVFDEGTYFLDVAGERVELVAGVIITDGRVEDLVGQKVEVLYSEPKRYVVGLASAKLGPILCYIPPPPFYMCYLPAAPWLFRGIEERVRTKLAERFLKEGLISEEVYEKLR